MLYKISSKDINDQWIPNTHTHMAQSREYDRF